MGATRAMGAMEVKELKEVLPNIWSRKLNWGCSPDCVGVGSLGFTPFFEAGRYKIDPLLELTYRIDPIFQPTQRIDN